jgi:hypothetical protein
MSGCVHHKITFPDIAACCPYLVALVEVTIPAVKKYENKVHKFINHE